MSVAAVHPARHALHTPTAEHSAPLSGSQYTPRAAYPSSVSLPAGAPAGAPSPPAGAGCAYRPPAAEQRPAPGACTRTSGCTCADCSASSAGVGPREPAVSMARTQLLPPPDERDLHNASYEMGGPAEQPTPPSSGHTGGGFGRRRVKPSPVLVGRRRRRRTAKDGAPAEEDPWAPPPRQRDNRMSLLRGRRPRALQKTVSSETPAWLADSNGSAATDGQQSQEQSQEKPMWLQSAPAATSSAPARDGGTGGALTPQLQLVPCSHCARCFKPDRLAKHEAACPKNPAKAKRQVYDSKARSLPAEAQQRKSAEEAKQRQGSAGDQPKKKKKKKSSWRQKSAEFQAMLRASGPIRASISGGTAGSGDIPEPLPVEPVHDDRVTCPHCSRKFNEDVAERHIPRCADVKARPRTLTKGGGLSASQVGAKATKRG